MEVSDMAMVEDNFASCHDHDYAKGVETAECPGCLSKRQLVKSMANKIKCLSNQVKVFKLRQQSTTKGNMSWRKIKTDAKMNFYTGIPSIAIFNALFFLLKPYCPNITYWQGAKKTSTKIVKRSHHKLKKLSHRDEFLMTLHQVTT